MKKNGALFGALVGAFAMAATAFGTSLRLGTCPLPIIRG